MTGEKRMFSSYEKNHDPQRAMTFGDGNQGLVKGLGKIAISPDHSISNVFLVDSLDYNLLSVSQLCKMGYNCLFTDLGVTVFRRSDDSVAFKGVLEGHLYLVDFNRAELDTCLIAKTNMGWFWHRRLAHVGMKNLHKLLKGEHILGLTNVHFEKDRVHHPHKNIMTTDRPLELLHMDLFGPIAYISIGGSKYCLVIVDDYSRFTWVFFLQEKSQTQETLKGFLRRAQNEFDLRIKKIRSDNGTEFKNSQIEGFLEEEGIKHEFSSPYMPQQNGVVERKNRTLLDMARTMLDEYKTSDRFWAEAVNTACYAVNRLYLHRILKKTSYELLTEQVDLDELDDEEAPCVALRNMSIGDVCPKESEEPPQAQDQPSSSMQACPPTQDEDQAQDDENEDQEEPPQEEDNDQGGDANNQDKEDDEGPRPPHPRVHQAIQRDHPVNSILGDIHKGVTTQSRVAHFCEHYSFVSSIEPYKVEDAIRDSDWVLEMQEELNNFTRNEV
jgi:transposase InsO family protein